jgi:hypothetical protein
MEYLSGTVRLRPTRVGFLVRPTQQSYSTVRQIMRLCCCLWGGTFNPIIPVATKLPIAWRREPYRELSAKGLADAFIRFFEPDVFVEAEKGLAAKAGVTVPEHTLHDRVVTLKDFVTKDKRWRADFVFGLNIFDAYRDLYERQYQFVMRNPPRFVQFDKPDAYCEAVFGSFPQRNELSYIRKAYTDAFKPDRKRCSPEDWLETIQNSHLCPLKLCSYDIEAQQSASFEEPTVYVFDPSITVDLIDYWNLRQFRRDVLPVNVGSFAQFSDFIKRFIAKNYRPLPGNPHGVMIRTTVEFSRSISETTAKQLVTKYLGGVPSGSWLFKIWYDPIWRNNWRGGGIQPRRARLVARGSESQANLVRDENSITFQSLSPSFAERFGAGWNHARWANILRFQDYSPSSQLAVTYLPNIKNPAFPPLQLGEAAIVSREGIVLLQQYKRDRTHISLLSHQDAIIGWLKWKGINANTSEAGRNANQILRSAGGLFGCWAFAHDGTVKLLDKMAKSMHQQSDGQFAQFPDRTATVSEWKQLISRRQKAERLPRLSLNTFIEKKALQLGMVLKCTICAKENWSSVRDIDYQLTCERCLGTFSFPQSDIRFNAQDWQYRVIGPFSVPNYANGAYATLLTLRVLDELVHFSAPQMTFSTGLDLSHKGHNFEIDFVSWYSEGQKFWIDPEPVLVFGETKSFGKDLFKDADLDRLKSFGESFPGSTIVLAAMKKDFDLIEKQRMRSFAEWGRIPQKDGEPRASVIVLTGLELFSQFDLTHTWKKAGGKHAAMVQHPSVNADDLWTLADMTQQLYLDLPPYWDWQQKRRRAKK